MSKIKKKRSMFKTEVVSNLKWLDVEKNIADRDITQRKYFCGLCFKEHREATYHTNVINKRSVKGFNKEE